MATRRDLVWSRDVYVRQNVPNGFDWRKKERIYGRPIDAIVRLLSEQREKETTGTTFMRPGEDKEDTAIKICFYWLSDLGCKFILKPKSDNSNIVFSFYIRLIVLLLADRRKGTASAAVAIVISGWLIDGNENK